jgi:predicted metal-dependent enzyme (double-stranded beta helix superfamily)
LSGELLRGSTLAFLKLICWKPGARPDRGHHRPYRLHAHSRQRFFVVSFAGGQAGHRSARSHGWGLIGVLHGAEIVQAYSLNGGGTLFAAYAVKRLETGSVDAVSPDIGDTRRISNALHDRASISIHVYGANVGAASRLIYPPDESRKTFISGYANDVLPNIWTVSKESVLL